MEIKKVEELLMNYLTGEDFELLMNDDMALLYVAFNGWFNNSTSDEAQTIVSSFIQYNLYKGAKSFEKKKKAKQKPMTQDFKDEWKKKFGVDSMVPSAELVKKTGCPLSVLQKIVQKGEGAYYSSGSRPNQTPQSWGLARLASALTNGKAAKVDAHLLQDCSRTYGSAPPL
jgi:hypothetical protein